MENRTQNKYAQAIRGIAILAVIWIHSRSHIKVDMTFDSIYYLFQRNLINFPVAVFFVLSGYFAPTKILTGGGIAEFYKKRAIRVGVPYLIFTTFWVLFEILSTHGMPDVQYLLKAYVLGKTVGPYYYVVVLIFFIVVTPGLLRLVEIKIGRIVVYLICFGTLLTAYYLQFKGYDIWDYLKYTIVWLPFYMFGMYAKRNAIKLRKRTGAQMIAFAYILEVVETIALSKIESTKMIAYSQIRISAFLYDFAIAMVILTYIDNTIEESKTNSFLIRLGNASFFVFLIHIGFIFILNKVTILSTIPLVLTHLIQVAFTTAGSLIMYRVVSKLPIKFRKMLGV